jgi:hypothetical protein
MNDFDLILPFLRPIEPLILDADISEIMVNRHDRVFNERQGYLEPVPGLSPAEKSLIIAVKNIARRLGGDISEAKPTGRSRGLPLGTGRLGHWVGRAKTTGTFQTRRSPSKGSYWKAFKRWLAGLFIFRLVETAVQEDAPRVNEFGRAFGWSMDTYAAALALLCYVIWR